jgi:hypothetical protein
MGAIERQVAQVKRKNSTSCSPPDARLTVVGSVAWSSGPREVAIGKEEGMRASVGVIAASVAGLDVERMAGLGTAAVRLGETGLLIGAQAARKTVIRARLGKRRILLICLLKNVVYTSLFNTKFLPNY